MRLVLGALGEANEVSPRMEALLLGSSRGNPLYMEEMARDLVEAGLAMPSGGTWELSRITEDLFIPSTLSGLLQSRLDRLPEDQRAVLQSSSTLGMEFPLELYASLENRVRTRSRDPSVFDDLERRNFLRCERSAFEKRYIFPSKLIHDAAYESMLESNRRLLHRAAAESIEELYHEAAEGVAATLAYHWEKAGDEENTLRWGRKALEQATRNEQWHDIIPLADGLIQLLESMPESTGRDDVLMEVLCARATAEGILGYGESQHETLEHAARIAEGGDHPKRECDILLLMANSAKLSGDEDEVRRLLEKALEIGRRLQDSRILSAVLMNLAGLQKTTASPGEATALYHEALQHARSGGHTLNEAHTVVNIGVLDHMTGRMTEAMERYREASRLIDEIGDRKASATLLVNMGILHSNQDRTDRALECYSGPSSCSGTSATGTAEPRRGSIWQSSTGRGSATRRPNASSGSRSRYTRRSVTWRGPSSPCSTWAPCTRTERSCRRLSRSSNVASKPRWRWVAGGWRAIRGVPWAPLTACSEGWTSRASSSRGLSRSCVRAASGSRRGPFSARWVCCDATREGSMRPSSITTGLSRYWRISESEDWTPRIFPLSTRGCESFWTTEPGFVSRLTGVTCRGMTRKRPEPVLPMEACRRGPW